MNANPTVSYRTAGGAIVTITHEPNRSRLTIRCAGCLDEDSVLTEDMRDDTPEITAQRVALGLPTARKRAQSHARVCKALPQAVN